MKRILTGDLAKNQINLPPERIIIDEVYVRFSLSSAKGNGRRANNFARAAFARKDLGGKLTSTPEALKKDEGNGLIETPYFPILILHIDLHPSL